MRSVINFVMALLLVAAWSPVVFAQQGTGGGPGPGMQNAPGGAPNTATFSERKARVLKMIEERKARLEEAKTCFNAAQNDEDLVKCRPQRPMRQGRGVQGGRTGEPGQRPPMGGMGEMP
jgi:hypothetical protein